jgi:hypothetical protein
MLLCATKQVKSKTLILVPIKVRGIRLLSWLARHDSRSHIFLFLNTEIYGYVPQLRVGGFPFPFLACDIDKIDQVCRCLFD